MARSSTTSYTSTSDGLPPQPIYDDAALSTIHSGDMNDQKHTQPAIYTGAGKAWVTVPVPDADNRVQFRPRGFSATGSSISGGATNWSTKSRYMMATRSGPTEVPDHILAKNYMFNDKGSFASPFTLYYFDETAPNNILISNDLKKNYRGIEDGRIPTQKGAEKAEKSKCGKDEALQYSLRKMFFDIDDPRVPENGTGLKMLPGYSVSYKNYPAVCYDVVAPKHYNEFFRTRKVPGMFI